MNLLMHKHKTLTKLVYSQDKILRLLHTSNCHHSRAAVIYIDLEETFNKSRKALGNGGSYGLHV